MTSTKIFDRPHAGAEPAIGELRLLWLDLTVGRLESELPLSITEHCKVEYCNSPTAADKACREGRVDVLCLDFDYPDRRGLRLLQKMKADYPSVPIIMLTLQHSESLAVWAYRTRVWDYLVKPVSRSEVERCFRGLTQVLKMRGNQDARSVSMPVQLIPDEAAAPLPEASEMVLMPALNYLEKNFQHRVLSEDAAALCKLSPFRFSREFKLAYGLGFRDYVLHYRLREACRMLENPNAVVTDVCYSCGFNDPSYFTRVFRKHFRIVPSAAVGASAGLAGERLNLRIR